jgi:hypothetical protein
MTQDKIREAFEQLLNTLRSEPSYMWMGGCYEPLPINNMWLSFTEGYQACAAEMGKDMEKMREAIDNAIPFIEVWLQGNVDDYNWLVQMKEALSLADKWRG